MRWQYRDPGLLWLFLPAYLTHLAEEWLGGFPAWVAAIAGRPVPEWAFIAINGVAIVILIAGIRVATRAEESGWIAVAIAVIALTNTAFHAAGALLSGSYSPGLLSAVLVYVPLGALTMIRAIAQAPRTDLARGVIAGVAIHSIVFALAFTASRMS